MTSGDVRHSFIEFFKRHDHRDVPSSPLVPIDDPTLLFTNAGMNQFKDVFLGKERRNYSRAVTSQKCMRVSGKHNDLDSVGPSLRHHTFFEMLGNFSFGDYFKSDAIPFAWQLLTQTWRLPADRLYATVFGGESGIPRDDEAYDAWKKLIPKERISEFGSDDNFWAMGTSGPCGRCSEVHYFRGNDIPCTEPKCLGIGCRCNRFIEIWNNVFMEFDRQSDGTLEHLSMPSVDTGMGLERIVAVLQEKSSNYDTDLFTSLITKISELTNISYTGRTGNTQILSDISMRVIADHMRATTFLITDGISPSNEWRGYVLRKIMRRAMRHGKKLMMTEPFLHTLVDVIVNDMSDAYPELTEARASVVEIVRGEEERFDAVLNDGLPRLETVLGLAASDGKPVPGKEIFRLYDTHGLPLDFIEDLAREKHLSLDHGGFERAMKAQRKQSGRGIAFETKNERDFEYSSESSRRELFETGDLFEGYTITHVTNVPILALFDQKRRHVLQLQEGESGYIVLERTPFYQEAGGQVSDSGQIYSVNEQGVASVKAVTRLGPDSPRVHQVLLTTGRLEIRDFVTAEVNADLRNATRRNHTATHLLHAALRKILGAHVKQAGSLVVPDRLRFDFTHSAPLSHEQQNEIENLINKQIHTNSPVHTEIRATKDAISAGAMALFGEKYGERVRVVSIVGFSVELCAGTHCEATGDIGSLLIVQETGIAAGIRRIEALTGTEVVRYFQTRRTIFDRLIKTLNVKEDQVYDTVHNLQSSMKRLTREISNLKLKAATDQSDSDFRKVVNVKGVSIVTQQVVDFEKPELRELADSLKSTVPSGVILLATANDNKVALIVSITKNLAGRLHAGQIAKEIAPIVGGTGGGRFDFAEAGGKEPQKITELLKRSQEVVTRMLVTSERVR